MKKRVLSMLLIILMIVGMFPTAAFAAETDGLCEHHTAHTAACGYVEGMSDCLYHCDECLGHTHDHEAHFEAAEECSCESDDPTWHAPFCAMYTAPDNPECYCVEKCAEGAANEWCDVCYFDAAACAASGEEEAALYASVPTYISKIAVAYGAKDSTPKGHPE